MYPSAQTLEPTIARAPSRPCRLNFSPRRNPCDVYTLQEKAPMKDLISLGEAASALGVSKEAPPQLGSEWQAEAHSESYEHTTLNVPTGGCELARANQAPSENRKVFTTPAAERRHHPKMNPVTIRTSRESCPKIPTAYYVTTDCSSSSIVERFDETTETSVLEAALRTVLQFLRHVRPPRVTTSGLHKTTP